ncbi:MAG TPA: RodZ domain-containing protein [Allosphingosinicella sp.]|nr:RodZ domain-containing protein [Allosphingosinicella sp.]
MSDYGEGEERFVSIGERLRRAREARAMSLDDVASQTRIPMRHLQHIELEEWDALPAPTYAIGFTRNFANAVGLDGPTIANELRDQIGGPRRRAPAPEYYEPADPARVPPRSLVIGVIVAAVLLVGAYLLWRNTIGADPGPGPEQTIEVPEDNGAAPAANGQAAAPADLTGQAVTLTALDGVWVRITDGENGPSLFTGILSSGQTFTVPATATRPVLRTGRPQMLRASAGGRDLGLIAPEERTVINVSLLPQDLAARASGQPPSAAPAPASSPAPAPAATARPARPRPTPPTSRATGPVPADPPPASRPDAPLSTPPPTP